MRARTDDTGPIITREEYPLSVRELFEEQTGSTSDEDEALDLYGPSSSISGKFDSSRSIVGPEEPESIKPIEFGAALFAARGRPSNGSSVVQSSVESGDKRGGLPPTPAPPAKKPRLGTASSRKPPPPQTGQIPPTERLQLNDSETKRRQPSFPIYAGQANPGQVTRPSNPSPQPNSAVSSVAKTEKKSEFEREPLIRPPKNERILPLKSTPPTDPLAPSRIYPGSIL
ncbi:hypothetical protein LTS15_004693 [Exophiala xenobiotica]|nr:hypothetical protein LTS15_004693 [Exophiala xenobiotica]